MANIDKQMRDVRAKLESNAFDLSERHLFSAKAGMLLPVYNKQVVPGDYFEIDPVSFLRTQRVNTASFARMRQHIDFFFVPYWQLYHRFPEMKYQRAEPMSALYGSNTSPRNNPIMSPFMDMATLYGNILCCNQSMDDPGSEVGSLINQRTDDFGYLETCNRVRLADLLGYGNLQPLIRKSTTEAGYVQTPHRAPNAYINRHVTLWPWLAYQKIYVDFYRNPWFDATYDPHMFNVDDCPCYDTQSADICSQRGGEFYQYDSALDEVFRLRYRQWKRDYFTGLFPDKQFGDVSQVVGNTPLILNGNLTEGPQNLNLIGHNTSAYPNVDEPGSVVNGSSTAADIYPTFVQGGISALDVRRAELLQIWKEKTMRAGSHVTNQQLAHFGVNSEYMPDEHVKHLGGYSEVININEVVSTSMASDGLTSETDGLGEIGGKATSLGKGDKIRFKAKDDGVIMAIFSVLPESEYPSFGLSPEHMRVDPFDYFTPGFQNLGFQAVTRANLDCVHISADNMPRSLNQVLGYAPPYYDMKNGVDKVHGEFIPAYTEQNMVTNIWSNIRSIGGSLQAFSSARRDAFPLAGTLAFFYVNPNVVDSVFAVNADSYQDTDEFIVNMFLDIKAVRPMSVLGLPNF